MSCLINRNQEGLIVNVTTPTGEKSQLFEAIHSNPFMGDAETSLRIFSSAYSKAIKNSDVVKYSNGEPKLYFKTPSGKVFDNIEQVIIENDLGTIMAGFQTADGFTPTVSFDTSNSEKARFLASEIKAGDLSPTRVLGQDGVTRFQGKGEFRETRHVTAQSVLQKSYLLENPLRQVGDLLEFSQDINLDLVGDEVISLEEIPAKASESDNKIALLTKYAELAAPTSVSSPTSRVSTSVEKSLFNFLESLGISSTTLSAYRKDYKTKYGQDPDIQAIADIANKVVAFSDGEIGIENLSEEVAHIAIEAFEDQNSIASMIAIAHLTPEYTQHSEYYRSKYAPFYEGVELEERVRKEVLGKILAKQFVERFNQQFVTEESSNVISKLRELWDYFMNFISNRLKPYHKKALADINTRIVDAVLNKDESFDPNLLVDGFFYNAMPTDNKKIEDTLKKAKRNYEDLFERVLKENVPNTADLERISEGMQTASILSSTNTIVGIATRQLNILKAEVDRAVKSKKVISPKETNRFNALDGNILKTLETLSAQVRALEDKKGLDKTIILLAEQVDNFVVEMGRIRPIMDENRNSKVEKDVESLISELDLDDRDASEVRGQMKAVGKDLTLFGVKFQLPSVADNIFVRMMQKKAVDINSKVTAALKNIMNPAIDNIYDNGLDSEQKKLIQEDENGKPTLYLSHMWDKHRMGIDEDNEKVRIMATLSGKTEEEVRTELEANKNNVESVIGTENYYKLRKMMQEFRRKNTRNSSRNELYYQERDRRFTQLNTSEYTQEYLSNVNQSVFDIVKDSMNADGTLDKTKLTEAQRIAIEDYRKMKEVSKSPFDQFGQVRTGLRVVRITDLTAQDLDRATELLGVNSLVQNREGEQVNLLDPTMKGSLVILEDGYTLDTLPDESRLAIDLSNTTLLYRQEAKARGAVRDEFFQTIESMEANGESTFDWVTSNATISLSDEFYANLGENEGFDQIAQEYISTISDEAVRERKQSNLNRLTQLQQIRKSLMRQNRRISNPIETDVKNMDTKVQQEIIDIDSELEVLYRLIDLPQEYFKEAGERLSSKGVNDDFIKMAKEAGLSHFDFAQKHMTENNKRDVSTFGANVQELMKGVRSFIHPKYETFINKMYDQELVDDNMDPDEILEILKNEYAKSKVASYFQRFEPNGYSDVMAALQSGEILMSEVLKNKDQYIKQYPGLKYLEFTPDYSWTEDLNSLKYKNEEYFEGGYYVKPKLKYMNDSWFDFYGIDKEAFRKNPTDDLRQLTPTKNQKAYNLLLALTDMREEANGAYGQIDRADKFKRVQITSQDLENTEKFFRGVSGVKETVKDLFQQRADEQLTGEMVDGETAVKVIPKFFQRDVEDPNALSESLVHAELLNLKQALLYKERSIAEADMKNYLYAISQQHHQAGIGSNGITRTGETSNWYKYAEENLNHMLYGIQQTRSFETQVLGRKVDLAKVVSSIVKTSQGINLAFSPLVAATSLTSGIINQYVNTLTGDKYSSSASRFATKEVVRLLGQHLSETGKVNKKNPMTQLVEMFNVVGMEERTKNTKYGLAVRLLGDSAFALDQFANIPITHHSVVVVLKDTRFYNGKFRTYLEFSGKLRREGVSSEEIKTLWSGLENDSLYDNIIFTAEKQGPNQKFYDKGLTDQDWEKIRVNATLKMKKLIQDVDGVISDEDRVAAQRDIVTNVLMQHKGWLLLNVHRGFKKRHLNLETGVWEEGHYKTLLKFIGDTIKNKGNLAKVIKEYKFDMRDQYKFTNLRRAVIETSVFASLVLLGLAIFAGDDDDDTYVENLAQLMFLRTYNEFNSQSLLGVGGSLLGAAKDPVASLDYIENYNPISFVRNIDQEDADGNNKAMKQIYGAIPAISVPMRRYNSLSDLENTIGLFKKNNIETLWGFTGSRNDDQE